MKHDQRICEGCEAATWTGQDEPKLVDNREQVLDPMTAYQVTSMLEGVVNRGTATVVSKVGKHLAGKTGTTNDERDAWFVGFSPNLTVGVFVGYDIPRPMGRGATGGHLAAPIFKEFMESALKDTPSIPFRVPRGIKLIPIDAKTGLRASAETKDGVILESFKPGTGPPDSYDIIDFANDGGGRSPAVAPDADRAIMSGSGGLY
jgi:penicillin-binding protein 1A